MKRLLGLATVLVLATGTGARAECYPPDPNNGAGHVDRSRVAPGECVTFSGSGFRPKTAVAVADNGSPVGVAQADPSGDFSHEVCFSSTAQPGQHELTGTGKDKGGDCAPNGGGPQALGAVGFRAMSVSAAPGERTVTATVYVLGAGKVDLPGGGVIGRDEGSAGSGGNGANGGGGLPFTGDITLVEGTIGFLLLAGGLAVLLAARPRRRSSSPA
ncbi:MAG TPA: hypothetical protein VF519_18325 [Mycobacteriales bacterium]